MSCSHDEFKADVRVEKSESLLVRLTVVCAKCGSKLQFRDSPVYNLDSTEIGLPAKVKAQE